MTLSIPRQFALTLTIVLTLLTLPAFARADDLTELSLEELMAIEVVSTPQFAGRITDLPASVSILTANDIRAYGWRTLADALRSLRGFNVTYDRTYSYAGVRGLSPPGDLKPRLGILIDGISATENIYDSVLLGGEFPLDIDLIERIEVVRGPSASVVGGDAMGGVVNIITRNGASIHGTGHGSTEAHGVEATVSAGSGDAYSARASVGGMSNGIDYLISASGYDAQGDELKFPEMAPLGRGITTNTDDERRRQLFAKLNYNAWHAELIHGERRKTVPTGSYGTVFDDASHHEQDTETLAEIGHKMALDTNTTLSSRVYAGMYNYDAIFPYVYDDFNYYRNRDRARGKWWGAETRVQTRPWTDHEIMAGAEFVDNYQQNQRNDDVSYGCVGYSDEACLDTHHNSNKWSLYAQDEMTLAVHTLLTWGARFDRTVDDDSRWSPRLGLVQHTDAIGTFKLLYATAYREPSAFESYYTLAETPNANPNLKDEYMQSIEAIWEYAINARTQFTAVVYHYKAEDVITPDDNGAYRNLSMITGRGAEFEVYRSWPNRSSLRASYSLQFPELAGERPANAPQHLLKLNATTPIPRTHWITGFEVQATSERRTEVGTTLGGYAIANLNFIYAPQTQAWEAAFAIYNLFDQYYKDPIEHDEYMDPSVTRDGIAQDGRTWRVKLLYKF